MSDVETETISIKASDTTGQFATEVDAPTGITVGELVQSLLGIMKLPRNDAEGRSMTYQAMLQSDRESRTLRNSEVVSPETVQAGDRVVLRPDVDAGAVR